MRYLKYGSGLLLVALLGVFWYFHPLLEVGTGYAAKMACSCHYLQGRSLEDIHANDLNFSAFPLMDLSMLEEEKGVEATIFGLVTQHALYVEGRGCVLVVDEQADVPGALEEPQLQLAAAPLPTYDSLPAGLDLGLLELAVDNAFTPLPGGGTRAVVVLHDGHLVHEAYAEGFSADTPLLGWSMTKSITNALVGILVKNGQLSLDQKALFEEWAADERAEITLADLLHMNSGLEWDEAYGGVSDATEMLYRQTDMSAYTRSKPLAYPPDTYWAYSSGTTNLLSRLVRDAINDDNAYATFARDSLFLPTGMHSARIEVDQSGSYVGSSYGWATARDWARFGQLYLNSGQVDSFPILPEGWVDYSVQPAAGSDGIYAAQIWLPHPDELNDVPEDLFMFRGFQDQRIVIIPSRNCVIVRLGMNDDQLFHLQKLISEVLAALPAEE